MKWISRDLPESNNLTRALLTRHRWSTVYTKATLITQRRSREKEKAEEIAPGLQPWQCRDPVAGYLPDQLLPGTMRRVVKRLETGEECKTDRANRGNVPWNCGAYEARGVREISDWGREGGRWMRDG